ncbi:DUF2971 domain-containing protein [Pseudomonas chlororaphis]|uniref:DUF2971 domain-containing protein n=1 Tax=Pseudomonas chlororaphis TaxID=587753 RepID=UPI000BE2FF3E|nr:DUF2971 domain-containing protein [Pseudomonas chlororaphis]
MLVYKYMPSARFFENLKFRFTPAEDLNDPRELTPEIRLRDPQSYASDIIQRNIHSAYLQNLISHPELSPDIVWKRLLLATHNHMQNFDAEKKVLEIYEMFMRVTNRNIGILSLTTDPLNELMWAHYGSSHSGYVVGLDAESSFFRPKSGEPKLCGELMNVAYTDTTPVVYVDPGKLDIPKDIFFTKTTKWAYENEWRMIKHLENSDEVVESGGKMIHLFEVSEEAIKEVIIGAKVDKKSADKFESEIRQRLPHVEIKRLKFHPKFGLTVA